MIDKRTDAQLFLSGSLLQGGGVADCRVCARHLHHLRCAIKLEVLIVPANTRQPLGSEHTAVL